MLSGVSVVRRGLLAGIGFTVSLLVAELSFAVTSEHHDHAKVAILTASVIAAGGASVLLGARNRRYRLREGVRGDEIALPSEKR